ncbi:helix-turn-helix domain-containing protein [Streptosporangium roseum]|uniref:helix-turn-helix domain-containing protein n=1 Tax=Streptosporangium roseum TaxID=2001 RepID=UPI00068D845D|nr:helix-turn-helix domain-containing protein [Streptosporangium roseum]
MPKLLHARPPMDAEEERKIRKLDGARHAPADWIMRAQIIVFSRQGLRTSAIAAKLGCHMRTVRERIERFNAEGLAGLADRPGAGRKPRITELERGQIVALARSTPPGRLARDEAGDLTADDESGPAQWTLDSLTAAARAQGIVIARSQVRRILRAVLSSTPAPSPGSGDDHSHNLEPCAARSSTCFKERRTRRRTRALRPVP